MGEREGERLREEAAGLKIMGKRDTDSLSHPLTLSQSKRDLPGVGRGRGKIG